MPSIYTNLKKSDRKYIAKQKALIRREFLDLTKQEEMITELYKRMVGKNAVIPAEKVEVKKEVKAVKAVKSKAKAEPKVKKAKAKK